MRDNRVLLLGVIGIIVVLCVVLYNLDFTKPIETPSVITRTVSIPTATMKPTYTNTPSPTDTLLPTITATQTPSPTYTSSRTATSSPTQTLIPTKTRYSDYGEVEYDRNIVDVKRWRVKVKTWLQRYIEKNAKGAIFRPPTVLPPLPSPIIDIPTATPYEK